MFNLKLIILLAAVLLGHNAFASDNGQIIPPDQAFKISAEAKSAGKLLVSWSIAESAYIYRDKIKIETSTPGVELAPPVLPEGEKKHDPLFGDVVIYRGKLDVPVPFRHLQGTTAMDVGVRFHGCSVAGVCYPPQKVALHVDLPAPSSGGDALSRFAEGLQGLKQNLLGDDLLPAEEAFRFFAEVKDPYTLQVSWQIADGYYMYRDKIQLALSGADSLSLGNYEVPHGDSKDDPEFGKVEVFHHRLSFDVPLQRPAGDAQKITLRAGYQGCEEERGVCYPPMQQDVELELPAASQAATTRTDKPQAAVGAPALSEQDRIVSVLYHDSLTLTLLSFFGFGLLLAFTPCIFPMIPILSGIIVGKGHKITTRRAFLLSLSYVLASALTYTAFGIIAALFGSNLQATFQNPWIISTFSAIFVVLALSMFGFYHLELPKSLQSYLHKSSDKHRDGTLLGAGLMGVFSSLIVGPCVAAPLAAALIYIGQTGDALLGGAALFMMGIGMGVPLLIVGASAGKLLPKAGHWLNATKAVFGVIMLAVAVWMLQRILPPSVTMLLWALLLIIPSIYLGALEPLPVPASGWRKFWKGSGLVLLVYGVLLLIGVGMGNGNPLQPLQGMMTTVAAAGEEQTPSRQKVPFERVTSLDALQIKLQQADAGKQWVMLDFYADWCVSCQEMEAYTFTDPKVIKSLENFIVLQADVTQNTDADKALLKRFNLVGPPATLFFAPDGQERSEHRVIGFQDAETFVGHLPKPD